MQAVILAGGFGTRLRPLTTFLPKPMVPVGDIPAMEHICRMVAKAGMTEQLSLLYFQPEAIQSYFGDGSKFGCKMEYLLARDDLGTAGSVGLARGVMKDRFLIISSDVVTNFDLKKAIDFHIAKKALATVVLTRVPNPLQYGVVITAPDGKITRFLEKPSWGEVFSDCVNTGIYIFEPKIFDFIPPDTTFDFSKNLFPLLLEKGEPLYGYTAEGYWRDIGTLEEYRRAHVDLLTGAYDLEIPYLTQSKDGAVLRVGDGARIAPDARFSGRVIVGPGAKIAPGAFIEDSVIGRGSEVSSDARVKRSVVWDDVKIEAGAELDENVVASRAVVAARASLGPGAIVAQDARIGEGAVVRAGVKVWPKKYVEDGSTLAHSLIWADRWSSSLFGSHGITGLASLEITPEFAARFGASLGAHLGKGAEVFSSRDDHRSSRMIARAIISGLLSAGVSVRDLRAVPLPVIRFNTRAYRIGGGFHCRVSPYESGRTDIKVFDSNGLDLPVSKEKAIENLFFREDFARAMPEETGEISYPVRQIENYRDGFLEKISAAPIRARRFKMVIDYSGGDAVNCLPPVLAALGVEVISLHAYPDEKLLARSPEFFEENLRAAASVVKGTSADLGIFLAPGGERVRLIDETGEVLSAEEGLHVFLWLALHVGRAKTVAVPMPASRRIERMAAEVGAQVIRTRLLHRAMEEIAERKEADVIGQLGGGFIHSDFLPGFDGMFASARLLQYLTEVGAPLSSIRQRAAKSGVVHETVRCAWAKKGEVMRRLVDEAGDEAQVEGIYMRRKDLWLLAIPDPDRPLFHIYAESEDGAMEPARAAAKALAEKIWEWHK